MPLDPPVERRCYLIYGTGPVFCAGADIGEVAGGEQAQRHMMRRLQEQPLPVVAWLNGPAIGAGAYLATISDCRLVSTSAYLRVPATRLGLGLSGRFIADFAKRLGHPIASRLLLAGRDVDAAMLIAAGAAEPAETIDAATAFCNRLASLAPLVVRGMRCGLHGDLAAADDLASDAAASDDLRDGIAAFRERRPPDFQGR
jgi:enoyl-CoA hydratase